MKGKYLWLSMSLIVISWVLNYTYYQSKQLEEPIFLKHYYETETFEENHFTFYYLANKQDTSDVNYVEIDGIQFFPQNEYSMWSENIPQHEQEFRHHYLRSVTIHFPKHTLPIKEGSDVQWSFEKMNIGFDNRPPMTVNIGKVNFYSVTNQKRLLETRMSSSSNQHRSEESLVALESVKIEAISIPFPEIEKDVEIKISLDQKKLKDLESIRDGKEIPKWFSESMQEDWKNVEGISVNAGFAPFTLDQKDWMRVMIFSNPERNSVFQFGIRIKGLTADGKSFTSQTYISDRPYLEQKDVDGIIADMKGGK